MGCIKSKQTKTLCIGNNYETNEQLVAALRREGLERCNIMIAIDFTKSNLWQGKNTFEGKSLHFLHQNMEEEKLPGEEGAPREKSSTAIYEPMYEPVDEPVKNIPNVCKDKNKMNPYQYVMNVVGQPLEDFDDDKLIPLCIFGHSRQAGSPYIKELGPSKGCYRMNEVIQEYEHAVQTNELSGNTQFTPVINWAIGKIAKTMEYNILLIIGDGCIDDFKETKAALNNAANYPLSIVFVGVGDGSNPENRKDKWFSMRELDDNPSGQIDNWQSVYLSNLKEQLDKSAHPDLELATWIMMEIPQQYKYFKQKGLIKG